MICSIVKILINDVSLFFSDSCINNYENSICSLIYLDIKLMYFDVYKVYRNGKGTGHAPPRLLPSYI